MSFTALTVFSSAVLLLVQDVPEKLMCRRLISFNSPSWLLWFRCLTKPPACSCDTRVWSGRLKESMDAWSTSKKLVLFIGTISLVPVEHNIVIIHISTVCWMFHSCKYSSWSSWIFTTLANKDITGVFQHLIFVPWQAAQNLLMLCNTYPLIHERCSACLHQQIV